MQDNYKQIIIPKLKWEFFIEKSHDSLWTVSIPDCGGMADMVAKNELQKVWCENKFSKLNRIKQVWHTVWEVYDEKTLTKIEQLLTDLKEQVELENN
jgi:hypothetical protein